jgi:hypothetical protein
MSSSQIKKGLRETGYVDGQNVAFEYRWDEDHSDRLPALAADLVSRKVDVIITSSGTPGALAAKNATSTIPIVFRTGDPVGMGLVASLARPGGNLTGFSILAFELAQTYSERVLDEFNALASKTVRALKANDAALLSRIVDPRGIVIGVDQPPMSAIQFRKELRMRRGVYCVLFDDPACKSTDFAGSSSSSSLQHLIRVHQVTIQVVNERGDTASVVSAVVKNADNPSEILFTLYFRRTGKDCWVLANIEYD